MKWDSTHGIMVLKSFWLITKSAELSVNVRAELTITHFQWAFLETCGGGFSNQILRSRVLTSQID